MVRHVGSKEEMKGPIRLVWLNINGGVFEVLNEQTSEGGMISDGDVAQIQLWED